MHKYLIYCLVDPYSGEIRYVGKSSNGLSRPKSHFYKSSENNHKSNWIRKVKAKGSTPIIRILHSWPKTSDEILSSCEIYWISKLKRVGCRLTNSTDGGEGTSGFKHSEVTKLKLKEINSGKILSEKTKKKMSKSHIGNKYASGTVRTEEFKRKVSNSMKGKPFSEEHKNNISKSAKTRKKAPPITEETRARLSKASSSRRHTEETKRKMSKSAKGFSKHARDAGIKANKGSKHSEEHKKKISDSLKGRIPWNKRLKSTGNNGEGL